MKTMRTLATAALVCACLTATAQRTISADKLSRLNQQRTEQRQQLYNTPAQSNYETRGAFYAEYNPMTWHPTKGGKNTNYQGVSIGFEYAFPIAGPLCLETGVKGQYFFRSEDKNNVDVDEEYLAGTVPVNLSLELGIGNGFALTPYAGLYGRYNFSGKAKTKYSNNTSIELNPFSKSDMGGNELDRFQYGWQAGVNVRVSDVIAIGGGYWADLNEIGEHQKLYGFNIRLGASF